MGDIAIGTGSGKAFGGERHRSKDRVASVGEEIANAVTHGLGALLGIAGLAILVVVSVRTGDTWRVVANTVFCSSAILLYLASTLYHSLARTKAVRIFETIDHAAIFVLIAGSYTAFALTALRPTIGWWIFGTVWAIAVIGIAFEAVFLNRWPLATLLAYIGMGWIIVLAWNPLVASTPPTSVALLFGGGLAYTLGAGFYALGRRRKWFHALWHLFVIAGTAFHWFAVFTMTAQAIR
ncbi:MAG: hemolysin III family protein [Spirochaetota bacterium]